MNSPKVSAEYTLSATCCVPPHKSKVWSKATAVFNDPNDELLIAFYDKIKKYSSYILSEIVKEYDNILQEKKISNENGAIQPVHSIFIGAVASKDKYLKDLIDRINKTNMKEPFSLSHHFSQGDEDVFYPLRTNIALSYQKPISNVKEYSQTEHLEGLEWVMVNTLDRRSAIFSKRHDTAKNNTSFFGSIYGQKSHAEDMSRVIVQSIAPYL